MSQEEGLPPLLSVSGLAVSFRAGGNWQPVVGDLSFDIRPRETLAIVGESGSGKSITALSLMGLVPTVNGRVEGAARFDGRDLLKLSEPEMRKVRGNDIAMIFQEPMTSLNPVMTIGAQIAEALYYHRGLDWRSAKIEALRMLDLVRIPDSLRRLEDYPHQFSGGMRQRVMIAMALACRPKLLIADEPTTALDVTVQAEILELMQELQREQGMALLFITHDMGVVAEIADRVLVMWRGNKVEEAPIAEIFARPRANYTRALIGAVPRLGAMQSEAAPRHFAVIDPVDGRDISAPGRAAALPAPRGAAPPEGAPLLEVERLTTRYPISSGILHRVTARVHAVEGVSFSLRAGETLALVGESGCGKSTAGRTILRLIEPTSGVIRFEGRDITRLDPRGLKAVRPKMQMIFQDPYASLDPRQTIGRAIAEPMLVHATAARADALDRAASALARVGLEPAMIRRLPHEFSGGQRQRIAIARALALGPKLIVADEAVSALDVSVKAQILNLMLDLQAEFGLAYLFISHDMAVVERFSHRIAVMYMGEIVEIGPRRAIIGNPQHPYTQRLLHAVPTADPARRRERGRLRGQELPSPIRPRDYTPPQRCWRTVAEGHFVQDIA
jgi:peptide/nickel transport system ATP-binding protein